MNYAEDVLKHSGRKGMKWGVHLFGRDEGTYSNRKKFSVGDKRATSEDHASAAKARSKPLHQLSNDELRNLINRMELETRYSKLTTEAPAPITQSRLSKGRQFATKLLVDIGKEQATRVAKTAASVRVEQALAARGHTDLAERLAPKKKKK